MLADWKILLRVLCFHERQNNRIAIMVTVCTRRGARRVKRRVSSSRLLHLLEKRGKITPSQMNLNIGILLSAVSGKASNCSAVWYVHKYPLVCAVLADISPLPSLAAQHRLLCLSPLDRNELLTPSASWTLLSCPPCSPGSV